MLKRMISVGLLLVLGLLAACAPAPAPTPVPTAPPTPPSADGVTPGTAVPSPTPLARATLPPTWTPVITPTVTPTVFQPTPNATETALALTPLPSACLGFGENSELSPSTFTLGQSVIVHWLPAQGAVRYRITVLSAADSRTLFTAETPTLQQELPAEIFTADGGYFWLVAPFDRDGAQFCPSATAFVIPLL